MKIGLMSAAFPDMSLEDLATWAADSGFGMLELACWPAGEGKDRKYGGVVHVDVASLTPAEAGEINGMLAEKGLEISSLGYYPNPLHPDEAHREHVIAHLKRVIVGAEMLGVEVVGGLCEPYEDFCGIYERQALYVTHLGSGELVFDGYEKYIGWWETVLAIVGQAGAYEEMWCEDMTGSWYLALFVVQMEG